MAILLLHPQHEKFTRVENKQSEMGESSWAAHNIFCACECACHVVFSWLKPKAEFADKEKCFNEPISSLTTKLGNGGGGKTPDRKFAFLYSVSLLEGRKNILEDGEWLVSRRGNELLSTCVCISRLITMETREKIVLGRFSSGNLLIFFDFHFTMKDY